MLAFLLAAGISCYVVLDLDRDKAIDKQHGQAEDQVQRALDLPESLEAGVNEFYACWDTNFSRTVRGEFGEDVYDRIRDEAAQNFGYARPTDATKVPLVIDELLRRAAEDGATSSSLEELADQLEAMPELTP